MSSFNATALADKGGSGKLLKLFKKKVRPRPASSRMPVSCDRAKDSGTPTSADQRKSSLDSEDTAIKAQLLLGKDFASTAVSCQRAC